MATGYGRLIKNGVNFSHDTAASISYDNTVSHLSSTDVQSAINELKSDIPTDFVSASTGGTFNGEITIKGITRVNASYLQVDSKDGTATVVGSSRLILGNNVKQGVVGNSSGRLVLYGPSTAPANIYANNVTSPTTLQIPSGTNGIIAVKSDIPTDYVSKSSGGTFDNNIGVTGVVNVTNRIECGRQINLVSNSSKQVDLYVSGGGSVEETGEGRITLGNSSASGTSGNSEGRIRFFGRGTGYTDIRNGNNTSDNCTIYLPKPVDTTSNSTFALQNETVSSINGGTFKGPVNVNTTISALTQGDIEVLNTTRKVSSAADYNLSLMTIGGTSGSNKSAGAIKLYDDSGNFAYLRVEQGANGTLSLPAGKSGCTLATTDDNFKVTQTYTTENGHDLCVLLSRTDDYATEENQSTFKSSLTFNPKNIDLQFGHNTSLYGGPVSFRKYYQGDRKLTISCDVDDDNAKLLFYIYNDTSPTGAAWAFAPMTDNIMYLGTPTKVWANIYSKNNVTVTSDRNMKKDIEDLDTFAKDFIMDLKPVSYRMIDGKSGRVHYGLIAQDVEDTLNKYNKSSIDFAGLCKDNKLEEKEVTKEEEYIDESGNKQVKTVTRTENVEIADEYTYSLRYAEFIAPLIKTVQLQEEKINSLEDRINKLESIIKQLTEK